MATVKEEHRYGKGSSEAFSDLSKAISMMGKVVSSDPDSLSIEGRIKYGIGASTKVKARVQQEGDQSIIAFESKGGDFAGRAARDNVRHLLETMTRVDDVDFDAKKAEKPQWIRFGYFALGGLIVLFAALVLITGELNLLLVIGALAALYVWGFSKLPE